MTVHPSGPPAPHVLPALDGVIVTAAGVEAFDCPVCDQPRDLVVPPCDGGRGHDHDDCPDRACAVCGFAVVVGTAQFPAAATTAAAPHAPRRAG